LSSVWPSGSVVLGLSFNGCFGSATEPPNQRLHLTGAVFLKDASQLCRAGLGCSQVMRLRYAAAQMRPTVTLSPNGSVLRQCLPSGIQPSGDSERSGA
jgi:hypothetical protein